MLDLGAIVSRFSGLNLLINSAKLISLKFKDMLELLDASKMVCFDSVLSRIINSFVNFNFKLIIKLVFNV